MEKVIFKNSRQLNLTGNLLRADSQTIIIMCHGFLSDKSSRGRFDRFAKKFQNLGYNVLAFDFGGCGESDDERLTLAKEIDDLKSALAYVKALGFNRIALHGHSLGTKVCLSCYDPSIVTMVLTGALTGPINYNWEEIFSEEQMLELQQKGYLTEHLKEGPRQKVEIDKQMLLDFGSGDQKELLSRVKCPVLIVHGNGDEEEQRLYEISKEGIKWLSDDSRLELIDGAPHSFMEHLDTLENLFIDWYKENL
ncbi:MULTISPECIES: S9 family peptidase [unclassified Bacillus (in: firmicutes)]|uniref:alpha/beta hydrolase family protein n=1 Tax=unclassified Bacillus (in: firmicutes) TaxID=185979 RepID=UPI0008EA234A|nr:MULTISPECIES: alpha/beta hydrolase [unclassified Bacillus (in: firmicutes)]SFB23710.1 Pimeloyl-ACP methyl ester carboxylesterase [Bacillus sp. UNCCL13]SFQ87914.1 Pimeloyl-ACP methyl ester carboxylesterase [Bacillus sp. cl95]